MARCTVPKPRDLRRFHGRTLFSANVLKIICDCLVDGLTIEEACLVSGVHKATLYRHLKKNPKVSDALEKAKVEGRHYRLQEIKRSKDWRAHAWYLEATCPERFGRNRVPLPASSSTTNLNVTVQIDARERERMQESLRRIKILKPGEKVEKEAAG